MAVLRLEDVHLDYPGRRGVLYGVHLGVPAGGLAVIHGRSGAGKSSLLSIAAGLLRPTKGQVRVQGVPVDDQVRAKHIGLVFQHLNLIAELSVAENVGLPLRLHGVKRQPRDARVQQLLARFGLEDLADRLPAAISGGEQQRAAIARGLARKPAVLLVDEPTGHLDRHSAMTVVQALQQAAQAGAAVVVTTHDPVFDGVGRRFELVDGVLRGPP